MRPDSHSAAAVLLTLPLPPPPCPWPSSSPPHRILLPRAPPCQPTRHLWGSSLSWAVHGQRVCASDAPRAASSPGGGHAGLPPSTPDCDQRSPDPLHCRGLTRWLGLGGGYSHLGVTALEFWNLGHLQPREVRDLSQTHPRTRLRLAPSSRRAGRCSPPSRCW